MLHQASAAACDQSCLSLSVGDIRRNQRKKIHWTKRMGFQHVFCHLVDQAVAFRQSSTRPLKYKPSYFSDGGTMKMYEHVLTSLLHTCTSSITAVRTSSSNPTARAFWASWIHWIFRPFKNPHPYTNQNPTTYLPNALLDTLISAQLCPASAHLKLRLMK